MSSSARIWAFAISSEPSYGGNRGYEDVANESYRYDSKVQYHAQVNAGDMAIVVVDDKAVGLARIGRVDARKGTKALQRCPGCRTTDVRRRQSVGSPFKCQRCGQEFTHPKDDEVDVTLYTARFSDWVPLVGVTRADARAAAKNRGQTAIRPLDPTKAASLLATQPAAKGLLGDP